MNDRSTDRNNSPLAGSTSRSLLQRVRVNEGDAWDRLISLYAPLVAYWIRRMNLPEQDVADVLQEVFQAVATHLDSFRKESCSDTFRGWLRTIARNKVYDLLRRRGREPQAAGGSEAALRWLQLPQDAEQPALDEASAQETRETAAHGRLYYRALELIREEFEQRTWQAFWRVVVDGRTPRDVGQELDMKPGTVRVAKCRVLQRLRLELGDQPGE